jgi:hypothetical protein
MCNLYSIPKWLCCHGSPLENIFEAQKHKRLTREIRPISKRGKGNVAKIWREGDKKAVSPMMTDTIIKVMVELLSRTANLLLRMCVVLSPRGESPVSQ